MKLQKLGGIAAIASVCVPLVSGIFVRLIVKRFGDISDPVIGIAAALSTAPGYGLIICLLEILMYALLLIWVLALHERMKVDAPYLTNAMLIAMLAAALIGATYSIVWVEGMRTVVTANDASAYRAVFAIFNGLQRTAGHLCGWTCLFISLAILRTHALSSISGWLLLITGILWLPKFIVPQIDIIVTPLSYIACVWNGISLMSQKQPQPAINITET